MSGICFLQHKIDYTQFAKSAKSSMIIVFRKYSDSFVDDSMYDAVNFYFLLVPVL